MPRVVLHENFSHLGCAECVSGQNEAASVIDSMVAGATKLDPSKPRDSLARHVDWRARGDVACVLDTNDSDCIANSDVVRIESFAHLVHEAWKGERVLRLRAVDLYFSILSELAEAIKHRQAAYRHLCTPAKDGKVLVQVVGANGALDFAATLASMFPSKEFVELLTPQFPTDASTPELSIHEVFATLFCNIGASYYDYESTMCGIVGIEFLDTEADWIHLLALIHVLTQLVGDLPSLDYQTPMRVFLDGCFDVATRLYVAFQSSDKYDSDLIADLFSAKTNCGSGHPVHIEGMLTKLFRSSTISDAAGPRGFGWRRETELSPEEYHYQEVGLLAAVSEPWTSPDGYIPVPQGTKSVEGRFGKRVFLFSDRELFNKLTQKD